MQERENFPQLFADTSNIPEIKQLLRLGIFSGITTNPLIVAGQAEASEPLDYYRKLAAEYSDLPISIQLLDEDEKALFSKAHEFASIAKNIVIKVPMFKDGRCLTLSSILNKEGIRINITGLMNAEQLTLAILLDPYPIYVSLFFNRIKDGGGNPIQEISRSREIIERIGSKSKIITGSIRKVEDVREALVAGAHIVTIPPKIVWEMIYHPQTEHFIERSQAAWNKFLGSQK